MLLQKEAHSKPRHFYWIVPICAILLLAPRVSPSSRHGNIANDLLEIINRNRTAKSIRTLSNNPGLGCIALQYAKQCNQNCSSSSSQCHPLEDDFTEIFAPNCGVELPTFDAISGRISMCSHNNLEPQEAFSNLVETGGTLLRNTTFTEAGVGIFGKHKHKGPYTWCVLLSNGHLNTSFVLDDLGVGIQQKTGCYSGNSLVCGSGNKGFGRIWLVSVLVYFWFSMFF